MVIVSKTLLMSHRILGPSIILFYVTGYNVIMYYSCDTKQCIYSIIIRMFVRFGVSMDRSKP